MRHTMSSGGGFALPPLHPWMRNLLIGLFVLYVFELVLARLVPLHETLFWYSFDAGFAPHQLITRYFVQGPYVLGVLLSLLVLYFFLPVLDQLLERRQLVQTMIAAAIGGTLMGLLLDALGIVGGVAMGWRAAVYAGITVFGLAMPHRDVRLFFVLPIPGWVFAWGTGVLGVLLVLAQANIGAAEILGAWAGVVAWWFYLGPGARQRQLKAQSRRIERELRSFQVLPGGRDGNRDDETWH